MSSIPQSGFLPEVLIRNLDGPDDFHQAEEVQIKTWGFGDRDLVPAAMFAVARNFGGQALGAFNGERMVGFALSFGAVEDGHAHFHSHMVAVLPDYRSHGLGRRIKMAQREDALRRGVHAIAWTFDPLQPRNAYFNLVLLGGLGVRYIDDLYGETSSPLHGGIPTDRLAIQWNLLSSRVLQALEGKPHRVADDAKRVPVPPASDTVPLVDRLAGQQALRRELLTLFQQGYTVTGFKQDVNQPFYLLEKTEVLDGATNEN
jgi:predicted GNAT superfamily acetyltransferase